MFTWIPSHIGIHGNTVVDREAKNALHDHVSNCSIPYTDIKPFIVKYILKRWQGVLQLSIANRQERESEQIMNLLFSEEATNFKARSTALASALKIELADGIRAE
jgi:ribonuclease HI